MLRAGSESRRVAAGAFLALGLAAAFYLFFQLTKQLPALAAVNASANDPYDAIGSFGIQAAAFFGLLAVVRSLRWSRGGGELSAPGRLLTVRSEMATVLAVGITLAGDLIAMVRHPALWIGSSAGREYAVLLWIMVVLDVSIGLYVRWASRNVRGRQNARAWLLAGCSAAVFVLILALYPEALRAGIAAALFAIFVGVALLFVPIRLLLLALLPASAPATEVASPRWYARRWFPWVSVVAVGVAAAFLLLSAEMLKESGGTAPPLAQLLRVAAVYVGIETTGLLVGFAALREPVGLTGGVMPNKEIERTPPALD